MSTSQKIKISVMTGKLKGFHGINTNTLTNEFCSAMRKTDAICNQCYSANMLNTFRASCVKPWQKNSDLLSGDILPADQLPRLTDHTIRLHGHGELINYVHLVNFLNIARHNPLTTFALWTKRKNLIRKAIEAGLVPDNFILIYSHPKTDKPATRIPVGFDKVFSGTKTGHITRGGFECTGKSCRDCMACYRKNDTNMIIEKVK